MPDPIRNVLYLDHFIPLWLDITRFPVQDWRPDNFCTQQAQTQ